jgi:hypothetical protein
MVEVIAINLGPSTLDKNCKLVRMVLNDSAIKDLGFLSIISCETGILFPNFGTIPNELMLAWVCLDMSFNEFILS